MNLVILTGTVSSPVEEKGNCYYEFSLNSKLQDFKGNPKAFTYRIRVFKEAAEDASIRDMKTGTNIAVTGEVYGSGGECIIRVTQRAGIVRTTHGLNLGSVDASEFFES